MLRGLLNLLDHFVDGTLIPAFQDPQHLLARKVGEVMLVGLLGQVHPVDDAR